MIGFSNFQSTSKYKHSEYDKAFRCLEKRVLYVWESAIAAWVLEISEDNVLNVWALYDSGGIHKV